MEDIRLDETTHDVYVLAKDLALTFESSDAIKQRLKVTLLFFKGEWFLNTEFGVPYYQSIVLKTITKSQVDTIFREQILGVDGVVSILTFSSTFNVTSREYSLSFTCKASNGDTIDLEI